MRVCGPQSVEVAAYARCLAQMSEDYSKYLQAGLPRPFYMPNPVPLYRQTLSILEKLIGPDHPEVKILIAINCGLWSIYQFALQEEINTNRTCCTSWPKKRH